MLNFAPHSLRAARKNYNAVPDRPPAEAGARRPRRPGHEIKILSFKVAINLKLYGDNKEDDLEGSNWLG